MVRIFLSHAHRDWEALKHLVSAMEAAGFEVWHSERDIPLGAAFQNKIIDGLQQSDWILVACSPEAAKSEWVKSEVHIAFSLKPERVLVMILDSHPTYQIHLHLPRLNEIPFSPEPERMVALIQARVTTKTHSLEPEIDDEKWFLDCGIEPEFRPKILSLARKVNSLHDFAARFVSPCEGRLQQLTFSYLTRKPPVQNIGGMQFILLPPGSFEYLGKHTTLKSPCYICHQQVSKQIWTDLSREEVSDSMTTELSVARAKRWTCYVSELLGHKFSLPHRDHLLYGLLTGLLETVPGISEYCCYYDVHTAERRWLTWRRDGLSADKWASQEVLNPLAERSETAFRLELEKNE
jgi:hypothetical protein